MSVKDPATVKRYSQQVAELKAALANLSEFVESLPAADSKGELPGLHYARSRVSIAVRKLAEASPNDEALAQRNRERDAHDAKRVLARRLADWLTEQGYPAGTELTARKAEVTIDAEVLRNFLVANEVTE